MGFRNRLLRKAISLLPKDSPEEYALQLEEALDGAMLANLTTPFENTRALLLAGESCAEGPDDDVECDRDAKFRTISGICNNLRRPTYGAAGLIM